ncbi:ester cyclase [Cohnella sp. 56]|uniref:ester cyclase n=1 Tax=Cohnella sp. 56 TaxID=3113722 RepID=UPI0030E9480E
MNEKNGMNGQVNSAAVTGTNAGQRGDSAPADVALAFVEQFWNGGDLACTAAYLADDYRDHAYEPGDAAGLRQTAEALWRAFPDQRSEVESATASGDRVVVRLRMTGTHLGDFRGTAATGQPIDVKVYREYRIEEGRIAEHWALLDTASLLRQIGAQLHEHQACRVGQGPGQGQGGDQGLVQA